MTRKLWIGWSLSLSIILAVGVVMALAGLQERSTEYPSRPSEPGTQPLVDLTGPGLHVPAQTAVLTFAGGPDPATGEILGVLTEAQVPATFFVSGAEAVRNPAAVSALAGAGNEIANGTFTFTDLAAASVPRRVVEIAATQAAIIDAIGRTVSLARPYGPADPGDESIRPGIDSLEGYLVVPSGPWSPAWSSVDVAATVQTAVLAAKAGQVITLPATSEHAQVVLDAIPRIVNQLRSDGYTFTTVSGAIGQRPQASMSVASGWESISSSLWTRALTWSAEAMALISIVLVVLGVAVIGRTLFAVASAIWQVRSDRSRGDEAWRGPVSIIVPAFNEQANIAATLDSLLSSNYPQFEVVVVDDGSTDGTSEILARYASRVLVLCKENGGKAAALNYGLARCSHEVVVMVDGDTVFEPDTLSRLVADMSDPQIGAIAGNTKVANRRGMLGRWQHLEYVVGMNLDRRMFQLFDCMPTVPGAIGAFRAEAIRAVGGVPTRTLAEDTDLTMAINLAGWRVVYAGTAVAWTEAPSSITTLARQRYRWSYGTMQAMWFHRRSVRPVLHGRIGHVGSRGIPYLATFQVIQPLMAPLIDAYFIYSIVFLDLVSVVVVWLLFTALQMVASAVALRMDGESLHTLWVVPTTQILYRQLLYTVVIQSTASAISGARLRWHTPPRTGAVAAGVPAKRTRRTRERRRL